MVRVDKQYCCTVDVHDPVNFAADKAHQVLVAVQNLYEGRCYGNAYVVEVTRIDKISSIHVIRDDLSGEAYVDVRFTAAVEVLTPWDILVGVTIVTVSPNTIGKLRQTSARQADTVVWLQQSSAEELAIAVGQTVSVRVLGALCPAHDSKMSVAAMPLTCDQRAPVFCVRDQLSAAEAAGLMPLVRRIEGELDRRSLLATNRRKQLWFFEALLYSYAMGGANENTTMVIEGGASRDRGDRKVREDGGEGRGDDDDDGEDHGGGRKPHAVAAWGGPAGVALPAAAVAVNLPALVRRISAAAGGPGPADTRGVWCRDIAIYRSSPLVARAAEKTVPPQWGPRAPVVERAVAVARKHLRNMVDFLVAVREMVEAYSPEDVASHGNVWAMMRHAQREPAAAAGA